MSTTTDSARFYDQSQPYKSRENDGVLPLFSCLLPSAGSGSLYVEKSIVWSQSSCNDDILPYSLRPPISSFSLPPCWNVYRQRELAGYNGSRRARPLTWRSRANFPLLYSLYVVFFHFSRLPPTESFRCPSIRFFSSYILLYQNVLPYATTALFSPIFLVRTRPEPGK